jgi:hypothetical protein
VTNLLELQNRLHQFKSGRGLQLNQIPTATSSSQNFLIGFVSIPGCDRDSAWYANLTGAHAAALMQQNPDKRLHLSVRPCEATEADHEALRVCQLGLIRQGPAAVLNLQKASVDGRRNERADCE